MSSLTRLLEMVTGKARFYLTIGGKPAVEIILHDEKKEIVAEIKNPVLAVELGLHELAAGSKSGGYLLEKIKAAGYKVKVKYKIFEIEL
jgi:hypothetical protein